MAGNVFSSSPLQNALAKGEERRKARSLALNPSAHIGQVVNDPDPIAGASMRTQVPVNILESLTELSGAAPEHRGEIANRAADMLAERLSQGLSMRDAVAGLSDQASPEFADAILGRAKEIADTKYPAAPAPATPAAAEAPPEERGMVETILDPFGTTAELGRGIKRGAISSVGAAARALGADETADSMAASAAQTPAAVGSWRDIGSLQDLGKYVYGGIGESVPEMGAVAGTALGATVAGAPALAVGGTALAASALFNTGRNIERQEEETGQRNRMKAIGAGIAQGVLDTIVPGKVGTVVGSALKNRITGAVVNIAARSGERAVGRLTKTAATEAVTEALQQAIEIGQADPDLFRVMLNPQGEEEMAKADSLLDEFINSALLGGAAGGVFGTAEVAATPRPKAEEPPAPEPEPQTLLGPSTMITPPPTAYEKPSGPLERAVGQGPAPLAPEMDPGTEITIETADAGAIDAVVVSESPTGLRVRADGADMEIPREEIESGAVRVAPRAASETAGPLGATAAPEVAAAEQATTIPEDAPPVNVLPEAGPLAAAATPTGPTMAPEGPSEADAAAIRQRLDFLHSQAKGAGWNKRLMEERARLEAQLATLEPQQPAVNTAADLRLEGMGAGIADSLYDHLWSRVEAGKLTEQDGWERSPILMVASKIKGRGGVLTREAFKPLAQEVDAAMSGPAEGRAQAMNEIVARYAPQQEPSPATVEVAPEAPGGSLPVAPEAGVPVTASEEGGAADAGRIAPPAIPETPQVQPAADPAIAPVVVGEGAAAGAAAPALSVEPIREKAAIIRGAGPDAPPVSIPGVSLKWDARAGGWIFSRKHVEKVQAALTGAAAPVSETPKSEHVAAVRSEGFGTTEEIGLKPSETRDEAPSEAPKEITPSTTKPAAKPDSPRAKREEKEAAKKQPPAAIVTQLNDDFGNWYVPEGSVLKSTSGRTLAPAPAFSAENNRKTKLSIRRQREWLIAEVRAEAEARGDRYMLNTFLARLDAGNFTRSDAYMVNEYLFGDSWGPAGDPVSTPEELAVMDAAIDEVLAKPTSTPAEIKAEVKNVEMSPTDGQKDAGNYRMGHIKVHGLDVTIETPKGGWRKGKGPGGTEWKVKLPAHYGYIRRTEGADGDHVDVYVGDDPSSGNVFIVDQIDPETGAFDEHKVVLGAYTEAAALDLYFDGFSDGSGPARLGGISEVGVGRFKSWLYQGDTRKPFKPVVAPMQPPKAPGKLGNTDMSPHLVAKPAGVAIAIDPAKGTITANQISSGRKGSDAALAGHSPDVPPDGWGAKNKLVTADRAAELRAKLKAKLRDQINSGIDPEILAFGTELAVFHIEAGARKFAEFAKAVAADLGTTPEKLRPYLRGWYQGAQAFLEDGGHDADGMDDAATVKVVLREGFPEEAPAAAAKPERTAAEAYDAGKAAFAAGERRGVPTDWIIGVPGKVSSAWLRGWDDANLAEPVPGVDLPGRPDPNKAAAPVQVHSLFTAFSDRFQRGEGFASITEARKFAESITGEKVEAGTQAAKDLDETIEAAIVDVADMIARDGTDPLATYRKLVALYESQPRLGVRTSDSIARQAYSTPVPLAYLASKLAGIGPGKTVYEPTAGNGALLIGADRDKVFANEIDEARAGALKEAGFDRVTMHDASLFRPKQKSDAVIANPPFGPVKDADGKNRVFHVGPGYDTREIDHAIVFNALDAMKDDGRAVLLIAGLDKTITDPEKRSDAYNTKAKREFYLWLKRHYKVADHFTVDGDLYHKQGAGWPIDVIVVEGRGEGSRPVPAVNLPQTYASWASLEEKLNAEPADRGSDRPSGGSRRDPAPERSPREPERDAGGVRPPAKPQRGADEPRPEAVRQPRDEAAPGEPERSGGPAAEADADPVAGRPSERPASVGSAEAAASGDLQVPYRPASGAKSVDTLVPVNMAEDVATALNRVVEEHGNIDRFVAKELGYTKATLAAAFSAEQVDALALALVNIQKNAGFIIGDQTGIGKGRVVAGMIRYALKKGFKPIFVTEKPNLYADMWRDMNDIGIPDMLGRPPTVLATNANLSMPLDEAGEHRLKTGAPRDHDKVLEQQIGTADMAFTTYTQLQTQGGNSPFRREVLNRVIGNGVLILDESHNAGGQGMKDEDGGGAGEALNRAEFVRDLAAKARAVMFSSATYAKRPDVMDLYAKTDMILAVDKPAALTAAIAKGGIPMQQAVAAMLSRAGQYLRRERSFAGIDYGTVDVDVDRETYDQTSHILDAIRRFSAEVSKAAKAMGQDLKADGKAMSAGQSTGGAGVDSTNFTSVMHNLIEALLLALNAKPGAERAIASLKEGRKPVLTVNFTMGTLLDEYASEAGISDGDPIDLDFRRLFERYLEKSRVVTIRKPFMAKGEKAEKKILTDAEIGPAGMALWHKAKAMIEEFDSSKLPASPIDYIRNEIQKAGYSVAEITGRNLAIDYSGPRPVLSKVPAAEKGAKGRTATNRAFNGGDLDAIILNQAGSTGLSLHAGEKFRDKKPRRMIIVQASSNIDTHMQMLGRVNRTGQVVLPDYEQLAPKIPATIRPAAVLAKKMASLNANTTGARRSAVSADDSIDVLNVVGDQAVMDLMRDEPDLNERLGKPISVTENDTKDDDGKVVVQDDIARRVTGRIPLLPIDEQERVYAEIFRRYKQKLTEMEASGENPLEAKTLEADAVLLEAKEVAPQGGPSPFQEAVSSGIYEINPPTKPIDIRKFIAGMAAEAEVGGSTPENQLAAIRSAFDRSFLSAAYDQHAAWAKAQVALLDEEPAAEFNERQATVRAHFAEVSKSVDGFARPGSAIALTNAEAGFTLNGIVTKVRKVGKTHNPLAASAWEMTVQTGVGSFNVPFSQIATAMKPDARYRLQRADEAEVMQLFDLAARTRREKRTILTGNMLTAFELANGRGSIVKFTMRDGRLVQGLMLRKDEELGEIAGGFRSGEHVIAYVERAGEITSTDNAITIKPGKLSGQLRVEIAAAKSKGGKYFLNAGVIEAAGGDFVSVGDVLRRDIPRDSAIKATEAMRRAGARFVGTNAEVAVAIGGEAAAPKQRLMDSERAKGWKPSIAPDATASGFLNAAVLRNHISQHPKVGAAVRKLLADGKLVLHDATAPSGRVQGMTDPDGVIHLYARNLGPQTAVPVLLHEAFHAGGETLVGSEAWARTLANVEGVMRRRLAATFYRELNDNTGGAPDFWDKARERLVPGMATAEELAAYAIEERAQAPAGLAERAETLLGKIKAFILRRFGWQAGAVTPAQLEALAVAALRAIPAGAPPEGGKRTANAYSIAAAPFVNQVEIETHERGIVGHALTQAMSGNYNLLALVPGRALFSELGRNMPGAAAYLRSKEEMDAFRSEWHQRADSTAQEWRKIGLTGDGNVKMMDIMHEATLAGVDPSKPFESRLDSDDRNALHAGKRGQDLDRALARQAEDQARAKTYADLRKRFKALPEPHQAMFQKVRDEYKALNDEFEATLFANIEKAMDTTLRKAERDHAAEIERITDEGLTGRERDEATAAADKRLANTKKRHGWGKRARTADLRAQFETQRVAEPYFPLARFGQFFVTTKDKETGKVIGFSRFETARQQAAFAAEQRADKGVAVEVGIIGEGTLREMVDPTFVTDVEGILMGAGVGDGVMDAVWQRWLETMPDLSLRKSRIHRKGTAGYNSDAFRAFGHHMFHGSHQLARLKHAMDLGESLDFAELQAKSSTDPVRAGLVVEEMRRRHEFTLNPKGAPWAQTISTAAFVYYLAMSPAAALVNLSQTTIVGTSILAAYQGGGNGFGVASKQLTRALADFTMGKGWAAQSDRLSADDKAALEEAYRRSTIDASQAHDLAGVSETGIEYNDLRTKWMSRISFFFHHGERMNREVTFLAAYRMARAKGLEHMPAIEKAADLTWKAHFDYANSSRPRLMQNDAAKVLLTFRNFSVNLLYRLVRDTAQSLHGASKEERTEARTQLAGITAMMALHAGVRGVWGYALAMTLIGLFLPDGSDDAEDWLKDAVVETLGTTLGGIVLNGVPGHLAGVDLTSRVGMPELWFRSPDRQLEGEDLYHYWLSELLGAGVGMVETGFRGVSMILDGNVYRGIETLMPKFSRDLMRASRFAQDGAQTLKGDELLPDMDVGQILGQALGFTPAQLAERYDQNSHLKNAEMRITDERSTLMGRYSAALRKGERPDEGVIRAIMVFNAGNPDYPITAKSLKQSHQARMRSSDRIQGGVSLNPKLAPRLRSEAPTPIYSE